MNIQLLCVTLVVLFVAAEAQQNFRQNNNNNNNNGQFRPNNGRFNNNVRRPVNNNNNNRFVNNNNNNRFVNNNNNNNRFVSNNNNRFNSNNNNNRFNNNNRVVVNNNNGNNRFRATPADALDASGTEVYPGCNGTVCLPEAGLCSRRQNKVGHFRYNDKSYWISWASDEQALRNARWNWFTGRNYCRKMCMDMVGFEEKGEQDFIAGLMGTSNVDNVHTAGRLCDKEVEGCNQTRFQPLHINGWFWASTLKMMPPTNVISNRFFNNWATTGEKNQPQPDGVIKADGFGTEACVALINEPKYGGLKWHDAPCNTRRQLVCEDLPVRNINFVRNQNPGVNIP